MKASTKAALKRASRRARGDLAGATADAILVTIARPTSDPCETFCRALTLAKAMVETDATMRGPERARHRQRLLVRATQGDLPSALAFASWVLGGEQDAPQAP